MRSFSFFVFFFKCLCFGCFLCIPFLFLLLLKILAVYLTNFDVTSMYPASHFKQTSGSIHIKNRDDTFFFSRTKGLVARPKPVLSVEESVIQTLALGDQKGPSMLRSLERPLGLESQPSQLLKTFSAAGGFQLKPFSLWALVAKSGKETLHLWSWYAHKWSTHGHGSKRKNSRKQQVFHVFFYQTVFLGTPCLPFFTHKMFLFHRFLWRLGCSRHWGETADSPGDWTWQADSYLVSFPGKKSLNLLVSSAF